MEDFINMDENYSFHIYSKSYAAMHSTIPTFYDWAINDAINKEEFTKWAFCNNNLIKYEIIGVKLSTRNALIQRGEDEANIFYTLSNDIFYGHYEQDVINFSDFCNITDYVNEQTNNTEDEESFWDDPEGNFKEIKDEIERLKYKQKMQTNEISELKEYQEINNLINSTEYDENKIIEWLNTTETKNINSINKSLSLLNTIGNGIPEEVVKNYEQSKLTNFHKLLNNAETINLNNSLYINLIFSNLETANIYLLVYIYIKKCILDDMKLNDINIPNNKIIVNILEKLKEKEFFNELKIYMQKQKDMGIIDKIIIKTKTYEKTINSTYIMIIDSMVSHINSGSYLIKNPFDMVFYNYLPFANSGNFSRKKYSYLSLELSVFNIIKNKLLKYEREIDIVNYLSSNREATLLIFNEFISVDSKATSHIMNIISKNFGKESLFELISHIISDMYQHYLFSKKNGEQIISYSYERILNNEIRF